MWRAQYWLVCGHEERRREKINANTRTNPQRTVAKRAPYWHLQKMSRCSGKSLSTAPAQRTMCCVHTVGVACVDVGIKISWARANVLVRVLAGPKHTHRHMLLCKSGETRSAIGRDLCPSDVHVDDRTVFKTGTTHVFNTSTCLKTMSFTDDQHAVHQERTNSKSHGTLLHISVVVRCGGIGMGNTMKGPRTEGSHWV